MIILQKTGATDHATIIDVRMAFWFNLHDTTMFVCGLEQEVLSLVPPHH